MDLARRRAPIISLALLNGIKRKAPLIIVTPHSMVVIEMTWTGTDPAKWAQQAIRKVKSAPQIIVDEMANTMAQYVTVGGLTPVDTGNLSRSVTIAFAPITQDPPGYHAPNRQNFDYIARRMPVDGDAYIGYRANYAHRVNYGFVGQDSLGRSYNQSGRAFLEGYVSQFPQVVDRAIARLNSGSWVKL